jgi:hypothetical protein
MEGTMRKGFRVSLIIAASAFVGLGGQDKPVGWKGEIAVERGVRVVKNPDDPLYGEFVFDLEEDLRIGGDPNKDDYYFPRGASVRPDENGNFFIFDQGSLRVLTYDRAGKFVRLIGRRGQGPGEYQNPRDVFIEDGNIYIYCPRELVVFDRNGTFIKKIHIMTFLGRAALGPGGALIGTLQVSPKDGFKQSLVQVNPEGQAARTIAEYKGECADSLKGMVSHWYSSQIAFTPLTVDSFAYGYSAEYKIQIADAEGRTLIVFTKEEKPIPISHKEKDRTRQKGGYFAWFGIGSNKPSESINFPDHRPYFHFLQGLKNDDRGRLYVVKHVSILERDGPQPVDVFSKEGIFLYRMIWPFAPSVIDRGAMYRVLTDEDTGECYIVRYRIKNWDKMKYGAE